jgi:hypothetical protein
VLIPLAAGAWLAVAGVAGAAEVKGFPGVRSVQTVQHEPGAMTLYNVVLDRRFALDELDSVSRRIRRTAPKTDLLLISYFLRGMKAEQEPWATSHFDPKLDTFVVRINETITVTNPPDTDLRMAGAGAERR